MKMTSQLLLLYNKCNEASLKVKSVSVRTRTSMNMSLHIILQNSPSHEEDFDDVGCNADLYASRQGAFQGSSRGSDERSQQQNDPHCFQSLSLD